MLKKLLYQATLKLDQALGHMPSVCGFRPLKGTFSAVELLRQGCLDGKILHDFQQPGPSPVESITELAGMRQHSHQPWPVFWVRSDDAQLVGSMLHWRDRRDRLCAEGVFHMPQRLKLREDRYLAQILVPKPTMLSGAWTSIASNWGTGRNYYHWLTDCLARLYVREHLPEMTRILLPANPAPYAWETLRMLGLADISEVASRPCVQPERFYFCSPTSMTGVWDPLGFDWLRSKFDKFRNKHPNGKPIFLTRRGSHRVPDNLSEIEERFTRNGFEIIDCGTLSVEGQIRMASAAPAIAGLHGAAMTNLLWAHPGTPVLELFPCGYLNACYEQMAFQGRLQYKPLLLHRDLDLMKTSTWIDQWRSMASDHGASTAIP